MLRFIAELKKFSEDKTKLIAKEMRDGGSRGISWLKLRSPLALIRTLFAFFKNPDHKAAQRNRMDALTYSNYLQKQLLAIEKLDSYQDKEQAILTLDKQCFTLYDYFKKVDPKARFTNILKNYILNKNSNSLINPPKLSEIQKNFYLLWPLYVASKHDESWLLNKAFNAHHALEVYQQKPEESLTEDLFKRIFKIIKVEINAHTQPIIEKPAKNDIDLDAIARNQKLGMGKELSSWKRWGDKQMGMELYPRRMQAFTIQSVSESGHVYGKPSKDGQQKQLGDGWYQYVILAKDAEDGSAKKHDMRYFPCAGSQGTQTSKPFLSYKKYIAHSELAGGLPVFAAGIFKIEQGVTSFIDDASGHYEMKDKEQKKASLEYARSALAHLGLEKNKAFQLAIQVMPEMSVAQQLEKYKNKCASALYGFFSAKGPGLPTLCENRPRVPKKLRTKGTELSLCSPQDELLEQSFAEKLNTISRL